MRLRNVRHFIVCRLHCCSKRAACNLRMMAAVPVLNPFAMALAAQALNAGASSSSPPASTSPQSVSVVVSSLAAPIVEPVITVGDAKRPVLSSSIDTWSENRAVWTMRLGNIFNALLVSFASIATFFISSPEPAPSTFARYILSGYLFFLGLVLMMLDTNIAFFQRTARRNCGFLFTYMGRALYILL